MHAVHHHLSHDMHLDPLRHRATAAGAFAHLRGAAFAHALVTARDSEVRLGALEADDARRRAADGRLDLAADVERSHGVG